MYYIIHEGAHLIYALSVGAFRQINFMGLGVQIGIYEEQMSNLQLGIFCLSGAAATMVTAYVLTLTASQICKADSKIFKACLYYITIAMLLIDPLYLSILCVFFGGGDMNGIALLFPEWAARIFFGVMLVIHCLLFWRIVLAEHIWSKKFVICHSVFQSLQIKFSYRHPLYIGKMMTKMTKRAVQ